MDIFHQSFTPPQTLIRKSFCLFPTNQYFDQEDYKAVMLNKEMLRTWSQSQWPEDDFSLKQNHEDLGLHVLDNLNHEAYGYMIFSLDKSTCYGSVYVNPLSSVSSNYHTTKEEEAALSSRQARIDCWVIQDSSRLDNKLEREIIHELVNWFKETWKIKVYFSARIGLDKRIAVYEELGLKKQMDLKSKTSEMTLLLF